MIKVKKSHTLRRGILAWGLVCSGDTVTPQAYTGELWELDLPGLLSKLESAGAAVRSEPVIAYFLYYYAQSSVKATAAALEFLKRLKAAGADVNLPVKGAQPYQALYFAVWHRVEFAVVEWLLSNGARAGRGTDVPGLSLIDYALDKKEWQTARALIARNAAWADHDKMTVRPDNRDIAEALSRNDF